MTKHGYHVPVGAIGRVVGLTHECFIVEWMEPNGYDGTNQWGGYYFEKCQLNPCADCHAQAEWKDYLCAKCRTQQTK
jgi:hypothetical protein